MAAHIVGYARTVDPMTYTSSPDVGGVMGAAPVDGVDHARWSRETSLRLMGRLPGMGLGRVNAWPSSHAATAARRRATAAVTAR